MRRALFAFAALSLAVLHQPSWAKEYGKYDPKQLLTVSEAGETAGRKYGFDTVYLDHILEDLSAHAKDYPPHFDSAKDKQRAVRDVKTLSGMLDVLVNVPTPDPAMLMRAASLNSMGHNLDIPGAAEKADMQFTQLLAATPEDAHANLFYGAFLVGVGEPDSALPYLEKAAGHNQIEALHVLGVAYLALGDKAKALENLEAYKAKAPGDQAVEKLIDAIRNGKIEFKRKK